MPPPPNHFILPQLDGNISFSSSISSLNETSSNCTVNSSCSSSFESLTSENTNPSFEDSWFSHPSSRLVDCENYIPVISGYRPPKIVIVRQPAVRRVIRRENKCIQALSLPIFLVYNMRSIWAKQNNFSADVHERSADLVFLNEVWGKSEN